MKRARKYLSVVFAIFWRDLKRLVGNPIALILILGACALPAAYAWLTTAANWDPYHSSEGIKVAVSNEDEGFSSPELGQIDIGKQVVDELKDNHELGWTFYDTQEEAVNSVYAGECYAAITIPKDFSKDFASIITDDFKHPTLGYYLNEKLSASAPDFTNSGVKEVRQKIDENFVKTVSDTVLKITQALGIQVEDKAEEANDSITQGLEQADEALNSTKQLFAGLNPTIDSAIQTIGEGNKSLSTIKASLPEMQSALNDSRTMLQELRSSLDTYSSDVNNALTKASLEVGNAAVKTQTSIAQTQAQLKTASGDISAALSTAQNIVEQTDALLKEAEGLAGADPNVVATLKQLQILSQDLLNTVNSAEKVNQELTVSLEQAGNALDSFSQEVEGVSKQIAETSSTFNSSILPVIDASIDDFTNALGALSTLVSMLDPTITSAQNSIADLTQCLEKSQEVAGLAADSLGIAAGDLKETLTDLTALQSSTTIQELKEYLHINPNEAAEYLSSPVTLETSALYPVKNYGSGIVCFFSAVALWIAAFVFVDLMKYRVDPEGLPPFSESQAYFGRWLVFMFFGLIPPLIICAGDLVMGIQCVSPPAFIFAGVVSCLVFVNLVYALGYAFRHIGKGLAVVLLILQIPGSSGLYPVQMLPGFFQALHPLLPFTYTIDAFREAVGGFYGLNYLNDLLILVLVFVPIGLFIGLVLGRGATNLNLLLDKELERTEMFDGEALSRRVDFRPNTMIRALLHSPEYRERIVEQARSFNKHYPKLKTLGWILLIAQFAITFILMIIIEANIDTKLILLACMVVGVVLVDAYMIVIAYSRSNLANKLALVSLPEERLVNEAKRSVFEDFGAQEMRDTQPIQNPQKGQEVQEAQVIQEAQGAQRVHDVQSGSETSETKKESKGGRS